MRGAEFRPRRKRGVRQSPGQCHLGGGQRDTLQGFSYYAPAAVGASFNAPNAGNYKVALELSVHGGFYFDPGKCRVIFKVDDQEALNQEFTWEDNKTFRPFIFDENWQPGAHKMTFELQPLSDKTNQLYPLEMRINSVTVQGPMDEKFWSRPKNYNRFFTKGRCRPEPGSWRRQYAHSVLGR